MKFYRGIFYEKSVQNLNFAKIRQTYRAHYLKTIMFTLLTAVRNIFSSTTVQSEPTAAFP
jgi:hypothetical protein